MLSPKHLLSVFTPVHVDEFEQRLIHSFQKQQTTLIIYYNDSVDNDFWQQIQSFQNRYPQIDTIAIPIVGWTRRRMIQPWNYQQYPLPMFDLVYASSIIRRAIGKESIGQLYS